MSQVKQGKEPLLRIAKRDGISRPMAYGIRVIAVLLSLVVSGIFIFAVTKLNPIQVYEGIYDGAFGTARRSWVTIRDTMMLLCIGVGLAPAFKMKFWNIRSSNKAFTSLEASLKSMRIYDSYSFLANCSTRVDLPTRRAPSTKMAVLPFCDRFHSKRRS